MTSCSTRPTSGHVRLGDVADVRIAPVPQHHQAGERFPAHRRSRQRARTRSWAPSCSDVQDRLETVQFPLGYHAHLLGEAAERQAAQRGLLIAAAGDRDRDLLPSAGRLRELAPGGAGLPGLAGGPGGRRARGLCRRPHHFARLAGRISHRPGNRGAQRHSADRPLSAPRAYEGETFGPGLILRGARERLSPILMTTLATGLALVPLAITGDIPGHEIEHPMAVVILGGTGHVDVAQPVRRPAPLLASGGGARTRVEPAAVGDPHRPPLLGWQERREA